MVVASIFLTSVNQIIPKSNRPPHHGNQRIAYLEAKGVGLVDPGGHIHPGWQLEHVAAPPEL